MLERDPRLRLTMDRVEQLVALPDLWRLKADDGGQDSLASATRDCLADLDQDVRRRTEDLARATPNDPWWTKQTSDGRGPWWLNPPAQPVY